MPHLECFRAGKDTACESLRGGAGAACVGLLCLDIGEL